LWASEKETGLRLIEAERRVEMKDRYDTNRLGSASGHAEGALRKD
jgi:hypothetical protein